MTVQIGAQTEYLNGHFHTPTLHTHAHTHSHNNTYTSPQQQQEQRYDQPSTKELAITSSATRGTPPPPLMGSAIVLVNDSALHCFGGRLENRELTNCHYVLDVETGFWEAIEPAPAPSSSSPPSSSSSASNTTPSSSTPTTSPLDVPETPYGDNASSMEPATLLSLSLTTDPVSTNSGPLSSLSIPPQPRYFHTLNSFGGQAVLFGGMGTISVEDERNSESEENESNGTSNNDTKLKGKQMVLAALNDLHVYDITTQRWEQKHPPVNAFTPRPRWAHMATVMDHFLVVIGGQDTDKNYVEDACVLDMEIWEWVATVPNIGQCGSYRTIAATGPSKQSFGAVAPSSPSFPSANASSPQTSSNLSWISSDAGNIDAMASISMVLSGRISAPSTNTAYSSSQEQDDEFVESPKTTKKTSSERLMSSELTPSFKSGKDGLSIYLYSNYNFQNLQRELKVITPHYNPHPIAKDTLSAFGPPSFSLVEKSQALSMMGHELPVGLRFPQGHVFQNQLIVTGTLIAPGKAPTLAIYTFNLMSYKWERLDTDGTLVTGSWNRTLLHPATGTLLIFGKYGSNTETDYANRIQHHDHLMMINLQAYGLYERPVPSLPQGAQDLGFELLNEIGLNDMHVSSVTGTLFGANSTVLAARWPEFASLLLSPPYVTPLILELPVPDDVVPLFLQYLYTGALSASSGVTAGMADYLLILARRYELNGLYALTMDILHQTVETNSMRVHTTALLAGELGLSARAISLALKTLPRSRAPTTTVAEIVQKQRLSRSFSGAAPPATRPPHPPSSNSSSSLERRRVSRDSRDSVSTDGGYVAEGILQQYRPPAMIEEGDEEIFAHGETVRQRKHRSPPSLIASYQQQGYGSSGYGSPLTSPGLQGSIAGGGYQSQQHQQFAAASYPSPLSPSFQSHPFMSQPIQTAYNGFSDDEGSGVMSTQERLAVKKRLQLQQYPDLDPQMLQQQQQLLLEQKQRLHEQELMLAEQHHKQQQIFIQKQLQLKKQQKEIEEHAVLGALDYHFGNSGGQGSSSKHKKHHTSSIVDTITSQKSNGSKNSGSSGKENNTPPSSSSKDNKDKKGLFTKMKPPKPKVSGADLMKSAGF